jgi:hypothetical protein
MGQKKKLAELHKKSLAKVDDFVKKKGNLKEEQHEKVHLAKEEWQKAWSKLIETLMVLERIEI